MCIRDRGKGAFLWVSGPNVTRFQSYWLTDIDVESIITRIGRKWRNEKFAPLAPVQKKNDSSLVYAPPAPPVAPVHAPPLHHPAPVQDTAVAPLFPLSEKRPLSRIEADECRRLTLDGMSKNALCIHVYGAKSTRYMEWINAALADDGAQDDGKIIKLRKAG